MAFIILYSLYLEAKNEAVNHLKKKLLKVFIIDFISRLLYTKTKEYAPLIIYKELLFSFMNCIQFYLFISFISSALITSKKISQLKIFLLCIIFFFITFSYEKFSFLVSKHFFQIRLDKLIMIFQSTCILYCIYKEYQYFKKYIYEIANNLKCKDKELGKIYLFILGSPQSCLFLSSIYYVLKILSIFINNPIYIIYSKILLNIHKEAVKYFSFCICQCIFFQYRAYKNVEDEINKNKVQDEIEKLAL